MNMAKGLGSFINSSSKDDVRADGATPPGTGPKLLAKKYGRSSNQQMIAGAHMAGRGPAGFGQEGSPG
jgi:hypothetical protein